MSQTELANENLPALLKVADRLARVLCDGARAGRSKKQLLATVTNQVRSFRFRCPVCVAEWPVMVLGRENARHICVVARRASFLNVRRRLEEHFCRVPLRCPVCPADDAERSVGDAADETEIGAHGTGVAVTTEKR